MSRFYIMPMILNNELDTNKPPTWHPKYAAAFPRWSAIDYGTERVCICCIRDITAAEHVTLTENIDVLGTPGNIDKLLTQSAVDKIQAYLEPLFIPADWINTGRTYRQVIKTLGALFQFNQRWNKLSGGSSPFKDGLDLSMIYADLPISAKATTNQVFDTLKVDRSSLNSSSTVREILKTFAQGFIANRPIKCGEVL